MLHQVSSHVPSNARIVLVPSLYPGQGVASTTRSMAAKSVILGDQEAIAKAEWIVVSRRNAYWPQELANKLEVSRVVYRRACKGVWLSTLYAILPPQKFESPPKNAPFSNVPSPPSHSSDDL